MRNKNHDTSVMCLASLGGMGFTVQPCGGLSKGTQCNTAGAWPRAHSATLRGPGQGHTVPRAHNVMVSEQGCDVKEDREEAHNNSQFTIQHIKSALFIKT